MINGQRCLGVIPARGGSKRLPRKNIMMLAGKQLIHWTIEAGLKSNTIDRLIVSTDDAEIAEIARKSGADVPFIRPADLGSDTSSSFSVLEHAYKTLQSQGDDYTYIVMLQPTSPLRTSLHIDTAAKLLEEKNADGVLGVAETGHPVQWCSTLPKSKEMSGFIKEVTANTQSQKLEKRYCLNGAVYITSISRMLEQSSHIYGHSMYAFIMERCDSIDIDSYFDFEMAELLISKRIDV